MHTYVVYHDTPIYVSGTYRVDVEMFKKNHEIEIDVYNSRHVIHLS